MTKLNFEMLKVIWNDFKKHVLPPMLWFIGAVTVGFLFTHFTGLRNIEYMRLEMDFVIAPVVGGILLGIMYWIKEGVSEYLNTVSDRARRIERENDGRPTAERGTSFEF